MITIDYSKLERIENNNSNNVFQEIYYIDAAKKKQGIYKALYSSGLILCEAFYIDDVKHGKQTIISPTNEVRETYFFYGSYCMNEEDFKSLTVQERLNKENIKLFSHA